jgi:hypothetical protein
MYYYLNTGSWDPTPVQSNFSAMGPVLDTSFKESRRSTLNGSHETKQNGSSIDAVAGAGDKYVGLKLYPRARLVALGFP